jgi:Fe-S oxidoreductase
MQFHPVSNWLGALAFLAIVGAGIGFFINAVWMRYRQLMQAKRPDVRWNEIPQRIKNFVVYVIGQYKLPKNGYWYSGLLHIFIFGAFMVLSVDTINFVVDGTLRMVDVFSGHAFHFEPFHLPGSEGPYQAVADTFRFLCIVGLGMAFVNRMVIRPKRLPLTRDAMYTLFFILGLMVFEVLQQAFGFATYASVRHELPEAAHYAWFSGLFARAFSGMSLDLLAYGFMAAWWAHLVNLIGFSNYVPYSKHSHVFAAPLNMFFMQIEPKGALRKLDIDPEAETEYFGARTLEDLSWKQVFDGLSCTECGRCTDNCPAAISGKPLRPMHIIVDLKHHMEHRFRHGNGEKPNLAEDSKLWLTGGEDSLIDPDVLWSCTTCRACMEVCPVGNEHIPSIVDMRRYLTMTLGEVGHGAAGALKKMERQGNPWGMPKGDREAWTQGAGVDVKRWTEPGAAEVLYWVGCSGAYDDRAKKVSQSVARLLTKAGVDFAILGNKERCTGDSARRLGDEYLFQNMATENIGTLNDLGVKKIVTHCPHCFNTLKNEYPQFGGNYEVIHHSELLSSLVKEGKLSPQAAAEHKSGGQSDTVVYHDSCYLGRYNDVYEPQRDIIDALPDVKRVEPQRTKAKGLCCGAGGGQMWMENNIGERMNYVRTDELLETKADVIAVACNFCMTMVDDGVKARNQEGKVEVVDLAELLDRRVNGNG